MFLLNPSVFYWGQWGQRFFLSKNRITMVASSLLLVPSSGGDGMGTSGNSMGTNR